MKILLNLNTFYTIPLIFLAFVGCNPRINKKEIDKGITLPNNNEFFYYPYKNQNNQWGFVDKSGKIIIDALYDATSLMEKSVGSVKKNGRYGLINSEGELLTKIEYYDILDYSEKGIKILDKVGKGVEFYNIKEKKIIGTQNFDDYNSIFYHKNQILISVMLDGKNGIMDTNGKFIVEPEYDYIQHFSDSHLAVVKEGKYGIINISGEIVVPIKYDYISQTINPTLYTFSLNNKKGLINLDAQIIAKPEYDMIDSKLRFKKDNLFGLMDSLGTPILTKSFISPFSDSHKLIAFVENLKFGFMNDKGKILIQPEFQDVLNFDESGLACVKVNNKWGVIGEDGEFVIEPNFLKIEPFENLEVTRFKGLNGLTGVLSKEGKVLIEPQYDYISLFQKNGFATISLNGKKGYINNKGKLLIPPILEKENFNGRGELIVIVFDNGSGLLKTNGEFINFSLKDIR